MNYKNIVIDGYSPDNMDLPFPYNHNLNILNKIHKFNTKILFVAFGAGKQERWGNLNKSFLKNIGVEYVVFVGGTFEIISGKFRRAPNFIQKIGLESLYRLIIEPSPKRLKRIIKSFLFLKYI